MAEKKVEDVEQAVADLVEKNDTAKKSKTSPVIANKNDSVTKTKRSIFTQVPVWGWVVMSAAAFFALLGFVAVGYAAIHNIFNKDDIVRTRGTGDYALRDDQVGSGSGTRGLGNGMMGGFGMRDDTNTTSRVSGVVTAVDGDTITVAGYGTTTKVKVTSSTTYSGSSEPAAVNDTITAFGSTSDDVLTARPIRLSRQ